MARKNNRQNKIVEALIHQEASRKNIPTAEFQSVMRKDEQTPIQVAYDRRITIITPVQISGEGHFHVELSLRLL